MSITGVIEHLLFPERYIMFKMGMPKSLLMKTKEHYIYMLEMVQRF